ncbi:N-acetylmuramoyl-L-alanine amidase [Bosea sp. Leaf344]|uniref:peptidoglycan recognition protein family protein n=1 Tax=Bosea sp. Leaf344 TaxID=1736346 RepID=UPI0006F44FB7|nr:N-acetylmuramoyl-L-alanine amidase [Bosea sp. Leaf344]KQU51852.1 N-acetylmuramoyl-L-alanine amidase [Bosea sp. Leaf344]
MTEQRAPDSRFAAKIFPSPNHGERKHRDGTGGRRPDMLILHYTGMPVAGEALQWLCNPVAQVSAHYFVFENGHTLQLVPEARRAWHAGVGHWAGETDINSCSIGIEIANPGHPGGLPAYPEAQIAATLALCRDICERWTIPPERVLAHSDIAPGRKIDPGENFPWRRFAEAGVGLFVEPAPLRSGRYLARGEQGQPVEALQAMFAMLGYGVPVSGIFDERLEAVVAAFQRHWRQEKVDGVADASTITTLRDLLALGAAARTG